MEQAAKKILIVEDNMPTRNLLSELVKSAGHLPVEAADGNRALDLVKDHKIDAGLVDQYMEPMGGFQLAERLYYEEIRFPMILITAHEKSDLLVEAQQKGFLGIMKKPVDPERLLKMLARILR